VDDLHLTYHDTTEGGKYNALHDLLGKLGSSISDKLPMLLDFPVNHVRLDLTPGPSFATKLRSITVELFLNPVTREFDVVILRLHTSIGEVRIQRREGAYTYCQLRAHGSTEGDNSTCDTGKVLWSLQKLNRHLLKGYLEVKKNFLHRKKYRVDLEFAFGDR
jgi:hypothetical protein